MSADHRHATCDECWAKARPGVEPIREPRVSTACCNCGRDHDSGIYVDVNRWNVDSPAVVSRLKTAALYWRSETESLAGVLTEDYIEAVGHRWLRLWSRDKSEKDPVEEKVFCAVVDRFLASDAWRPRFLQYAEILPMVLAASALAGGMNTLALRQFAAAVFARGFMQGFEAAEQHHVDGVVHGLIEGEPR